MMRKPSLTSFARIGIVPSGRRQNNAACPVEQPCDVPVAETNDWYLRQRVRFSTHTFTTRQSYGVATYPSRRRTTSTLDNACAFSAHVHIAPVVRRSDVPVAETNDWYHRQRVRFSTHTFTTRQSYSEEPRRGDEMNDWYHRQRVRFQRTRSHLRQSYSEEPRRGDEMNDWYLRQRVRFSTHTFTSAPVVRRGAPQGRRDERLVP